MKLFDRIKLASSLVLNGPRNRYEGATTTPNRSIIPAQVQSARWDVNKTERTELLRRARYFEKNNAFVNRLADLHEQYTVGQGIGFFPASSDPAWNEAALTYWRDWQNFPDLSSRLSWGTLQGIISRATFIDGEIFILLTTGDTGFPRVQLIESHRVRNPNNQGDSDTLIDGVEIDGRGRPIAFHMVSESATRQLTWQRQDAAFVIPVYEPGRAGQYRGLTALYPVMNDLNDLDDLQIFEMQAAKHASEVTNVIKTKTGETDDDDLIRGNKTGADGVNRADYYRQTFGGKAKVLMHGDEFGQFKIERPSAATAGYWDYLTKKICSGVGIPVEIVLAGSMQGTSMRSVLDVANTYFRSRSSVLADHFKRVYEYVIASGIKTDPTLKNAPADWYRSTCRPPRSINVDIGRNSAAMVAEFKTGMRTLQSIYAETGEDWREQLRQKAQEIAYAEELANEFKIDRAEIMTLDPNELSSAQAAEAAAGNTQPPTQ